MWKLDQAFKAEWKLRMTCVSWWAYSVGRYTKACIPWNVETSAPIEFLLFKTILNYQTVENMWATHYTVGRYTKARIPWKVETSATIEFLLFKTILNYQTVEKMWPTIFDRYTKARIPWNVKTWTRTHLTMEASKQVFLWDDVICNFKHLLSLLELGIQVCHCSIC